MATEKQLQVEENSETDQTESLDVALGEYCKVQTDQEDRGKHSRVENANISAKDEASQQKGTDFSCGENMGYKLQRISNDFISDRLEGLDPYDFSIQETLKEDQGICVVQKVHHEQAGEDMVYKKHTIVGFEDEKKILWVDLGTSKMAPGLYFWKRSDSTMDFLMEYLPGMSLTEVYKKRRLLIDHNLATDFALWTLWKILEIQEKLMELNFAHNDMHGGNFILLETMEVKILDFEEAINLNDLSISGRDERIEKDIVSIICILCMLYSGVEIDDQHVLAEQLKNKDLSKLKKKLGNSDDLPEDIIFMMVNTLTNPKSFGETKMVSEYVKDRLPKDVHVWERKVARILGFKQIESETSGADDGSDTLYNDPVMKSVKTRSSCM